MTSRCHVPSWFYNYNKYDNLFILSTYVIIFEFIFIYLNDLKLRIQK